ncbi:Calcium uptake protein 1, mitochondrial [Phytophthora pseudosyringae]|uniref:Calcium uptake protein 1, mitochondrial n=1 Tax=Phytophthora pseudosyringae TaxID=221518 RepID=A0A8T1VCH2_9STRA|nr:Calcium uptake protein 1, mitochondrial [Phytophthora pseudosyringae]
MVRGVLRVAEKAAARCVSASHQSLASRTAALQRLESRPYWRHTSAAPTLGMAAVALAVAAATAGAEAETRTEASQLMGGGLGAAAAGTEGEETSARVRGGRRLLLKQRTKHQAKVQEEDQMKTHLDEYKQRREAIDSLHARFDMYASKSVEADDGRCVKAMTFTDFLHSFVLPQFHLHSPRPDLTYSCEFVGDANALVTYEECYLLIHLLQSEFLLVSQQPQVPKEHFDVAFCMFDLDGDGSVDKAEFCAVIENVLRAITTRGGGEEAPVSAEHALPRLTKFLFGRFGKTITAKDLEAALDALRKQILRVEFDLYATVNPLTKQQTMSVHDFALTLISCFDPEKLPPYLDRVQALNASDGVVTWEEFFTFHFNVQSNLSDIKLAFELTGAEEITEADFIRAAHVVSGVELSSPVVQLAFRIFDENANGTLDQAELFKVLEMRNTVQLKQKSNAGSRLEKLWHCVKEGDKN